MNQEPIAMCIALKAGLSELAAARALGYSGLDAYGSAFQAMDSVYLAAFEVDKPMVMTRFRPIRRAFT